MVTGVKSTLYIIYILIYIIYKYNANINIRFSFVRSSGQGWYTFTIFEKSNELMYHCTTALACLIFFFLVYLAISLILPTLALRLLKV